jgi:short-subunit dehydrogenase
MDRFESATLVVIGSGPDIGVSTASLFAARKFHRIALISRNQARLEEDRSKVCQAAAAAGRTVEVRTWSQDVTKTVSFKETQREVAEMGDVSRIIYNTARVGPSNFVTFKEEELLSDFAVSLRIRHRLIKGVC